MKICIINMEPLDIAGGAGTASFNISKEMSKKGIDTHYLVLSIDNTYYEEKIDCMTIYHYPRYNKKYWKSNVIKRFYQYMKECAPYVNRILDKINPDIVISFGTFPAFQIWLHNILSHRKRPYIISFRHDPLLRSTPFLPISFKKIWKFNPIIKNALGFTTPSIALAKHIQPYFEKKIVTIPNGISESDFYYEKKDISIIFESPTLLCLSRLSPGKRVGDVIFAMPEIINRFPTVKLNIIGDGTEKKELESLATKLGINRHVHFIGHVPHNSVISYYHSATIFILSSLDEGFPNTFLEAIACGLPVISTPVSDLGTIISENNNGIIVDYKSPKQIADAVCNILSDKEKYILFTSNSLKLAEKYSWDSVADEYIKYISYIIE